MTILFVPLTYSIFRCINDRSYCSMSQSALFIYHQCIEMIILHQPLMCQPFSAIYANPLWLFILGSHIGQLSYKDSQDRNNNDVQRLLMWHFCFQLSVSLFRGVISLIRLRFSLDNSLLIPNRCFLLGFFQRHYRLIQILSDCCSSGNNSLKPFNVCFWPSSTSVTFIACLVTPPWQA